MEATPERFADRCLPLVIGNQAGWDVLNPTALRARWNGGPRPGDVVVEPLDASADPAAAMAVGHFGAAILTFSIGYLFRTPPGVGLFVCGPPNSPKDGIYPLSGLVETDWSHATFTMNYRFTRRAHWVEFAAGEPICRIIPVDRHLLEGLAGEIRLLSDEPALAARFRQWSDGRAAFNKGLLNPFSEQSRQGWQREYFQGVGPSGERIAQHQTQLRHREFTDHRPGAQPSSPARAERVTPLQRRRRESAAQYLWEETDIYDQRRIKSATVLAGIARVLQARRPLGGSESRFLDSFERVRRLPAEEFTRIWREPRAYHWTRVAFQLLDAVCNGTAPAALARDSLRAQAADGLPQALTRHLDAFRWFEFGAAAAFGRDLVWTAALTVQLPGAIPGTRWTLDGTGSIDLEGLADRRLRGHAAGQAFDVPLAPGAIGPAGMAVRECRVCKVGEAQLRLQPEALAGLGLAEAAPALAMSRHWLHRAAVVIDQAIGHIAAHDPWTFRLLAEEIQVIAPKGPAGEYSNTTFSALPGAMVLSLIPHPLEMADRIIHEVHHDRLFAIEDAHLLLEDGLEDRPDAERCYSPWRQDPRPARGLLHGLYVFIAVGRFWLRVFGAEGIAPADHAYAAERLRRFSGQLRAALAELEAHARFTPFGQGVFGQLREDVETLSASIDAAGVPADPPALEIDETGAVTQQASAVTGTPLTVNEALREHRRLATGM